MLKTILRYLVLPAEITGFERAYLARTRRIALIFFYAHVPVLMGVAAICGTGVLRALLLGLLALAGPTLACFAFSNPRSVSRVFAFTAMCMGGLLVHFGQGSMQIEMHFYFFVLLALLAVFADPLAIVIAAATVALHHLVLYLVLPSSVFNYEASLWTVLVHALFVVLESVAACFVARSFFDNVIGLERIVQSRTTELVHRTRDLRLVLDNVGQGFLTVGLDGRPSGERSAILETWLGPYQEGESVAEYLAHLDPGVGAWFQLGWEAIVDDVLPIELALDQLPKRLVAGALTLDLDYRPILHEGAVAKVLLVVSDVTAEIERASAEAAQRDLLNIFERARRDGEGLLAFVAETEPLVRQITRGDGGDAARAIHTVKGTSGMLGFTRLAELCHALEDRIADTGDAPTAAERAELAALWEWLACTVRSMAGEPEARRRELDVAELARLRAAVVTGRPREEILEIVGSFDLEPAERRLARLADHARSLAARLAKPPPEVLVEANGIRLDPDRWAPLWSALVHVVRNAVDHGIEAPDARVLAGKHPAGSLVLRTSRRGAEIVLEIADDGGGVDWSAIADRAQRAGLPADSSRALEDALFHDGFTTKDAVTECSGRGIGLGAARAACLDLGGSVELVTARGAGTSLLFRVPDSAPRRSVHPRRAPMSVSPISARRSSVSPISAGA